MAMALVIAGLTALPGTANAAQLAPAQPEAGQYHGTRVRAAANVSIAAGATLTVKVTGIGDVPATGVATVALNLAVKGATAAGGLIAYPSDLAAAPAVTGSRYRSGVWDDQLVMVKTGPDGQIKVKNTGTGAANLYADVHGYTTAVPAAAAGARYVPLDTARVISNQSVAANSTAAFAVTGTGGVPATGVAYVAITLTVKSTGTGRMTAHPSGTAGPAGSNIDYRPSYFLSNLAIVAPGADGKIAITNAGGSALTVYGDVAGYFAAPAATVAGSAAVPVTPARIANDITVAANGSYTVAPLGKGGVPASGVTAVGVNLTAKSTVNGLLRIHPTGQATIPSGGSIAYQPNDFWNGFVTVKLGADGTFVVKNPYAEPINLAVDTFAYFRAPTVPGTPSGVAATAGNASATVTWARPADNGAPITGYTVTASPGGVTATTTGATTATVTGLSNGTAYTFTVTATSAAGTSAASTPSDPVTPAAEAPPGAPFVQSVHPRDGALRVSWLPPDTGTQGLTEYVIRADPGGTVVEAGPEATEAVVTGLANGTPYSFTVTAHNGVGAGSTSWPSTPMAPVPAETPAPPGGLMITPGDGRLQATWLAALDGGSAVTGYTVKAEPGGATLTLPADATAATLSGLTNGTAYTVSVTAANKAGSGEAATSDPVKPAATRAPEAPGRVWAGIPAQGSVKVSWDPPTDPGTSPITGYRVTAAPGGASATTSGATTATLTGLDPAVAYTFTVTATSAAGTSPAGQPTTALAPRLQVKREPAWLSAASVATLRSVQQRDGGGTLLFENPPAQVTSITPGTLVLVERSARVPDGFMGLMAAAEQRNGQYLIHTKGGTLADAYSEGDLALNGGLDEAVETRGVTFAAPEHNWLNLRIVKRGKARVLEMDGTLPNGTLKIDGWVSFTPYISGKISTNADKGASIKTTMKTKADLRVRARYSLGSLELPKIHLRSFRGPCFTIPMGAGAVPVCLNFVINVTAEVDTSVGVTLAVHYDKTQGLQCQANKSTANCAEVNEGPGRYADRRPGIYGEAEASFNLPIDIQFLVFRIAGPALVITPFIYFIADTTRPNWWELRVGIGGGMAFVLSGISKDYSTFRNDKILSWEYTIAAGGPFQGVVVDPTVNTVAPAERRQLKLKLVNFPGNPPIGQWKLLEGVGTISTGGEYVSDKEGEALVEAYVPPDEGRPALTTRGLVKVGTKYGTPGPPVLNTFTKPLLRGVSVHWKPPENTGVSEIKGFLVMVRPVDGSSGIKTVYGYGADATHQLMQGLESNVEYTVSVLAQNSYGSGQPSAPYRFTPLNVVFPGPPSTLGADQAASAEYPGRPDSMGMAGGSAGAAASGDGRYVFFLTRAASNLVPAPYQQPSSTWPLIVRKDTQTSQFQVVSFGANGVTPVAGFVGGPIASRNGNVVAFTSLPNTLPLVAKPIVHDIAARTSWTLEDEASVKSISDDGQVVLYLKKLVQQGSSRWNLYRQAKGGAAVKVTTCASQTDPLCPASSGEWALSGDGNRVVWDHYDPTQQINRTLMYDASTGATKEIWPGVDLKDPVISGNGQVVAAGYTNPSDSRQCLVVMRVGGPAPGIGNCLVPSNANGVVRAISLSMDGAAVAYQYVDQDLATGLYTYTGGATHKAGEIPFRTWPTSAFITDDNQRLIYTLGHEGGTPPPGTVVARDVAGVWMDFTSVLTPVADRPPVTWAPGPKVRPRDRDLAEPPVVTATR